MSRRRIAVLTGTRAEYGILVPLLLRIQNDSRLDLFLYVTGLHLLPGHDSGISEMRHDGVEPSRTIPMYPAAESATYHAAGLSSAIDGLARAFDEDAPDILVLFGDRLEPLAGALAAATLHIPIGHIHGGDRTDSGHIDESIRNSLTQFAHIHFPAAKSHEERLIRMGEEPWRIHRVGALGLDSIRDRPAPGREVIAHRFGFDPESPIACVLFHPVRSERSAAGSHMREILQAAEKMGLQTVMIHPNNDAGSEKIIAAISEYEDRPGFRAVPNLAHGDFLDLMRIADVLIGNSSSGLIESPSFGIPVINVGQRNLGREHSENVIFAEPSMDVIKSAIGTCLSDEYIQKARSVTNPYGDGESAPRITETLANVDIDERLMRKRMTY